jgi:hypothetical protein
MKKFVTRAALLLILGVGVCSTVSAKPNNHRTSHKNMQTHEQVSFIPLHQKGGFAVMVDKLEPGSSMVIIYDQYQNVVFKDRLTKGMKAEKKYILSNLDNGDYTVEVFSKAHDIKTSFYVYDNGRKKIVHMI